MKRLLIAAALLPALAFAQEDFTLKGKVGAHNAPAKVFLTYRDAGENKLDSSAITNGEFKFSGTVSSPLKATLVLSSEGKSLRQLRGGDYTEIYLSKGVSSVNGQSLKEAVVAGTEINKEFSKYKLGLKPFNDQMTALNKEYSDASDEMKNDPKFMEGLQEKASKVFEDMGAADIAYIKNNPKSIVALNLLSEKIDGTNVLELEKAFAAMPAEFKSSAKGKDIALKMEGLKSIAIGAIAPDFTIPDTTGTAFTLSSLRGKYVLIDFWASWCGPCRQENPHVVAAFNKFKDKGFTILGVSLDRPGKKDDWMNAIEKDNLQGWTQVSNLQFWNCPVAKLYQVRGIPQNFLLDKDGKIVASNLRGAALEAKLAEVLK